MSADPIARYLERLKRRLPPDEPDLARIAAEAERDLRASAADFAAGGWSAEEAANQAVAQYPSVEALMRRAALDAPVSVTVSRPLKLLLTATIAAAALAALWSASSPVPVALAPVALAPVALALSALAHGLVTLRLLWTREARRGLRRTIVWLGGLLLAAASGPAALWLLYLGVQDDDWDSILLLQTTLVAIQGGLAAWLVHPRIWSPWLE